MKGDTMRFLEVVGAILLIVACFAAYVVGVWALVDFLKTVTFSLMAF
jgi:hypothetical protein